VRSPTPNLSTPLLLAAYRRGWFPMADPLTGAIEWFNPDPRAIIPINALRVGKSLTREVRRGRFEITCDRAFEAVMRGCADRRPSEPFTWIDERMVAAYLGLHESGYAHSIEAWLDGRLVGGLYGVHVGAAFFGESMFHRPRQGGTNASKICLVHLVLWMRKRGMGLLDTQFWTEHLDQFGCVEIPREDYLERVAVATRREVAWGDFEPLPLP